MNIFKALILWLLCVNLVFGAKLFSQKWKEGQTFAEYLEEVKIDFSMNTSLEKEDEKYLFEIQANQIFYILKDKENTIEQLLIPIGEEMQIRLARERESGIYLFDIIPIVYEEKEYSETVTIYVNPHSDIKQTLNHPMLADKMSQLLKGTVDTRRLNKGDKLSFIYHQKTRMGLFHYQPEIKIAMLTSKGKEQFIYADEEGYGYTSAKTSQAYTVKDRKKVTYIRRIKVKNKSTKFMMPLRHVRVTSSFSRRRYHPILKRYRPHHGTDFGAKRGTPLLAVNAGKVIYSGYMGGYGKVVKIKHSGGYVSLYAHQSRIRVKRGASVRKGQVIGYVGSTGRSTGPHLHFGLTKNGRWVNPMRVLSKRGGTRTILKKITEYKETSTTKYKTVEIKDAKKYREKLIKHLTDEGKPFIWNIQKEKSQRIDHAH
ncbi:Membrane proteins related to metalloendopeptidases [hydrothermal vent metagenome]|uniref:Membrane proteins related to metalloendopeptidases n=1 Tax=hydrothermal vent metagenome TaxID=652676 RepID=A0A1W1D0Q5_9ZZZZ